MNFLQYSIFLIEIASFYSVSLLIAVKIAFNFAILIIFSILPFHFPSYPSQPQLYFATVSNSVLELRSEHEVASDITPNASETSDKEEVLTRLVGE